MEENARVEVKSSQGNKKNSSLIIALATMIACCTVFAVLCVIGIMPIPTGNGGFDDLRTAALVKESYQVEDEETLRELLYLKKDLDIVVTKDIEISEPLIVRGNKTLYGDAKLYADLAGEFRTMYLMEVQVGSSLTMDGLVLDGGGIADGINVGQKAELTYLSGTIQYMRNAIYSNGTVTMEDGLIQHVSQNGIISSFRSKAYIKGGTYYNGGGHLLNTEINGYMEVYEGALVKGCVGDAVYNFGVLNIYGGEICDTIGRAVNTEGQLHMEYKGEKKDGYIEMHDIGAIAVRMSSTYDCYISDVHAVNIGTNAVYTTDLRSNGKTVIEDCVFDTTSYVEGNIMSVSRKVEIKNVVARNSYGGGLNLRPYSDIKIDGLVIDGTKGNCISSSGELEMENVELSNVNVNNLVLYAESEATVKDCIFGQTKRTNIFMTAGTTLNMENVQIEGVKDDGIFAIQCNAGSTVNMIGDDNVISGATRVGVCLYKGATLNMEGGKICDNHGNATGAGVWVREEGSTFNMKGGTICDNSTTGSSGGVFVADKAIFNMSGGTITGNKADYSGGGVQVQGVMNMSGGTISNNYSKTTGGGINVGNNTKKNIYGKLNMTGGTISNNTAGTNGGGISVSGKTTANITGGTIKGNKAKAIGDGIADNGYLTISRNAYIPGNDVGLVSRSIILKIAGNTLNKHSVSDPLVVTPHFKTKPNQYVVIECDSDSAATTMLNKYIKSGSSVYTLLQKESKRNEIIVNVNDIVMDLNTAGAETVYVSNFQQLKEAVETTETKRNIVLRSDIVMESLVTVPAGTTVCIRDDGTTRTLTRNSEHTTLFFETWYGTGLILEGTSEGKLVLDGKTSGDAKAKNISPLVKARGTTEVTNVTFKNNGKAGTTTDGALLFNEYGYLAVTNSTFENGYASRGGAIYLATTEAVVTDCKFKNNTSTGNGGAIYNAMNSELTLNGTDGTAIFEGNKASGNGGAVCVGTGTVTVEGYTFTGNRAVNGGAIRLNTDKVVGTIENSVFTNNTASDEGGAVSNASILQDGLTISGTTFEKNSSSGGGGAIAIRAKYNTDVKNTTFSNNKTEGQGGAILSHGKELAVTDCEFISNSSKGNGGAVYSGSSCVLTLKSTNGSSFESNTTSANGGAICIGSGTLDLTGYTFVDNSASNGGAIRLNDQQIIATVTDCVFETNTASNEGGAVSNASQHAEGLTVTDSTFEKNEATVNGGAIYNASGAVLTLAGTKDTAIFEGNIANGTSSNADNIRGGGAICVGSGTLNVDGYTFKDNEAKNCPGGAIQLNSTGTVATIQNSEFAGNTTDGKGGAIYSNATLQITDTSFTENESASDGGAIYGKRGNLVLTTANGHAFEKNTASIGGAVYMDIGTVSITGYQFTENSASNGGAVRFAGSVSTAAVTDCVFESNKADAGYGGAISNNSTSEVDDAVIITDCTFESNTAKYGAAIHNRESDLKLAAVKASNFKGNNATEQGGAIYVENGNVSVEKYTFDTNSAKLGGAIFVKEGSVQLTGTKADTDVFKTNKTISDGSGGAIYMDGGNLGVNGYKFESNIAHQQGGAIWMKKSTTSATVQNSEFTENSTRYASGGAIWNGGALTLNAVNFTSNSSGTGGAAINCEGGDAAKELTATSCNFTSNTAKGNGGAIALSSGSVADINGTGTFKSNKASGQGGAIRLNNAKLSVTGYTFDGNSATGDGGAIYVGNGAQYADAISIANSTFVSNSTSANGGAIFGDKDLTVTSSTFDGNTAVEGGAIKINEANIKTSVAHSIFKNNTASTYGGAICNYGWGGCTITDCQFGELNANNQAVNGNTATNNRGGAIYHAKGGKLTLVDNNTAVRALFAGNTAKDGGGAICLGSGSLTMTGYEFDSNTTAGPGGAIRLSYSNITATVKDSVFTRNTASGNGGAIYNDSTSTAANAVSITDCTFGGTGTKENPYVLGNTANRGGAIYNSRTNLTLVNDESASTTAAIFEGNKAGDNGGAIYIDGGALNITGYQFVSNNAKNYGGAICHRTNTNAVKMDILNCIFTSNSTTASHGGAIYHHSKDDVDITGTDFTSNATAGHGGAICSEGGNLTVTDCDFTSNKAGTDGGAYRLAASGKASFTNGTFTSNSAGGNGGAVQFNTGTLFITNYTFEGNTSKGNSNSINTNNRNSHHTTLSGCTINASDITGKGVNYQ